MPPRPRHPVPAAAATAAPSAGGEEREVEWQLAAPDLGVVRRWLEQHPLWEDLRIEPRPTQQLHDVYLDTEDWRLFRAGFALRLRENEGRIEATLKGIRSARNDAADRREISEPLPKGGIKGLGDATGPVGSRVRDVAGVKPLRPLFEVRNSRQRFAVRRGNPAADVGEIALDEARFTRTNGRRRPLVMTRVELEAIGSDSAPLERLAERLHTECGLDPAKENKFAVGLRAASLELPWREEPSPKGELAQPLIDASTRASDFAAAVLQRLLDEWHAHEPAARLGECPEALHALRVTVRRVDTVLCLFGGHLPAAVRKGRPRLKNLLDALGTVRDADIRLEAAARFRDSLPEGSRRMLDPLLRQLESERGEARSTMLRALDAKPSRDWLDSLPAELTRTVSRATSAPPGTAAALAIAPGLIRRRYRKLRKRARRLSPESSLRDYHEVRIRTKKLRYALEIVAATYGRPAEEMLAGLHKLQGKLGAQHDAGAVAQYLQRLATRPPAGFAPETLFTLGAMAERHARKAGRLGGKVEVLWHRVRGKRWKALRSRMRDLCDDASESNRKQDGPDRGGERSSNLASASGGSASSEPARP